MIQNIFQAAQFARRHLVEKSTLIIIFDHIAEKHLFGKTILSIFTSLSFVNNELTVRMLSRIDCFDEHLELIVLMTLFDLLSGVSIVLSVSLVVSTCRIMLGNLKRQCAEIFF